MKVLMIVPRGKFNYKAPWTPIGAISISTVLKQKGHEILFLDRCFNRQNIKKCIERFHPQVVCVSVASVRVMDDAVSVSKTVRALGLPVIWGGFFATDNYEMVLKTGCVDYVSLGEGELNLPELIEAIGQGESIQPIAGIAYIKENEVMLTAPYQIADLKDLPVLDFSFCQPENYLHRYLFCEKMMYLYATKGCPGECTFCSNPRFHCYKYRVRPIEDVIEEIKYLNEHYGLDGVYFSDECWYLKRGDMLEFCRRLEEEEIHIYWGCELRFGIYNDEDLQYMYDHGCRWIFFGLESGDAQMLKKVKKNISISKIKQTVAACNQIGIVAISSFIIGYPDESKQQLMNTINLVLEIRSGISVCNIFTPMPHTEIFDELVENRQYEFHGTIDEYQQTMAGEYSPYHCNTIAQKDLRVIRSWFMWKEFTKKSVTKSSKKFEVALNAIEETFKNLKRYGLKDLLPGIFLAAKEAVPIFWYAHFYPSIKKKYGLQQDDFRGNEGQKNME